MYEVMSKKLLVINILDILNKYSDAEHRLKQKDFIDILRKEYGMEVEEICHICWNVDMILNIQNR